MTSLSMIGDLKRQYAELLSEIGFITPPVTARSMELAARKQSRSTNINCDGVLESVDEHLNANNGNMALLKAILCAALYPNVLIAEVRGSRCTYKTRKDGEVALHPSSVNAQLTSFPCAQYMIYLEKVRTRAVRTSFEARLAPSPHCRPPARDASAWRVPRRGVFVSNNIGTATHPPPPCHSAPAVALRA